MVAWILSLFVCSTIASTNWRVTASEGPTHCDERACKPTEEVQNVSTGKNSRLRLLLPGRAIVDVEAQSNIALKQGVHLNQGQLILQTAPEESVLVVLGTKDQELPLNFQGVASIERTTTQSSICLEKNSSFTPKDGETYRTEETPTCWYHSETGWEPVENTSRTIAFSDSLMPASAMAPLAFETPPDITVSNTAGSGEGSSGSGDSKESGGGGGESICLDSGGGGSEAGDVGGENGGVEIERGKARLHVRVEVR